MHECDYSTCQIDEISTLEMVKIFNREDQKVAVAVQQCQVEIAAAIEAVTQSLQSGGRLCYLGSGTAGKVAVMDASECPPTFGVDDNTVIGIISGGAEAVTGWREDTEDDEALAVRDLKTNRFSAQDILVCVSASGNTPYVLSGARYANMLGAKTIGICCSTGGRINELVDIAVTVDVGPEIIIGSTRLKAGTAQKMVLNMISSCAMIRLGKTYGNLMVNVRPLNEKLQQRMVQIVQTTCGCDAVSAKETLVLAENDPKVAIVMLIKGISPVAAKEALNKQGGYLKKVLED